MINHINRSTISAKPRIIKYQGFGGPNKSRDGSLASMSLMTPAMGWNDVPGVGYLYDGNRAGTWAARTGSVGNHTGIGVQINFTSPQPLKAMYVEGHITTFAASTFVVQYYNGSSWVTVWTGTGNDYAANGGFFFNLNGSVSSNIWRWYMTVYSYVYSNFYLFEVETYNTVIYK